MERLPYILPVFLMIFIGNGCNSHLQLYKDDVSNLPTILSTNEMQQLHGNWTPGLECRWKDLCPTSSCHEECTNYIDPMGNYKSYLIDNTGCTWCSSQIPDTILKECKMGPEEQGQICGIKKIFVMWNCYQAYYQSTARTYSCHDRYR